MTTVKVPARATEPTSPVAISQSAPTSSKGKAKAKVMFTNVPSESYEYVIIKNGTALNEKTAAWKTISPSFIDKREVLFLLFITISFLIKPAIYYFSI